MRNNKDGFLGFNWNEKWDFDRRERQQRRILSYWSNHSVVNQFEKKGFMNAANAATRQEQTKNSIFLHFVTLGEQNSVDGQLVRN